MNNLEFSCVVYGVSAVAGLLSLVAFAVQRDRTYVVITSMVLFVLLYSLMTAG